MKRTALRLLAAGVVCGFGFAAQATTIDFTDAASGGAATCIENNTSPCFGDNVTGTSSGGYTYGQGNGFTPNVATDYNGGRLVGALIPEHGGGYVYGNSFANPYTFTLTAEAGFNVLLNSITIKNAWLLGSSETETFEVWADGTHLSSLDFTYTGEAPDTFLFSNLVAQSISIIADNPFVGIAGANFDQMAVSAVPIPPALPLFAAGLAGLGFARWRKNRQAVKAA